MLQHTAQKHVKRTSSDLRSIFCLVLAVIYPLAWFLSSDILGPQGEVNLALSRWLIVAAAFALASWCAVTERYKADNSAIFLIALLITIPFTPSMYESVVALVRLASAWTLAFAISTLDSSNKQRLTTLWYAWATVFVFASISSYLISPQPADEWYSSLDIRARFAGLAAHPQVLGYVSALLLTWSVLHLSVPTNFVQKSVGWSSTALAAAAFYMSDSRTGLLAGCIGAGIVIISASAAKRQAISPSSATLIRTAVFVLTAAVLLIPIAIGAGYVHIDADRDAYELSTLMRLALWSDGIDSFWDQPLVGSGLGTSLSAGFLGYGEDGLLYYHSSLLNFLAKTGLVGALGFVFLVWSTGRTVLKSFLAQNERAIYKNTKLNVFAAGTAAVTISFSITEGALQGMPPSWLFFFSSAALLTRFARITRPAACHSR